MKYKVICNNCNKPFIAETEKPGRAKYRCPNCGHVMVCQLGETVVTLPKEKSDSVSTAPKLSTRQRAVETGKNIYNAAQRSSVAINTFQKTHKNGDLWLFFGFSLLFVVLVVAGLIVGAEMAKLIHTGKSWLFRLYLDVIHSL